MSIIHLTSGLLISIFFLGLTFFIKIILIKKYKKNPENLTQMSLSTFICKYILYYATNKRLLMGFCHFTNGVGRK